NEPGLYLEGKFGIRCENLVATVPWEETEFGKFLQFKTMTLFPFDLTLFDTSIMSDDEIKWINDYHTEVRSRLTPLLTADEAAWLADKTRPLVKVKKA
ncbi:MAG: M24 family metallopeptidase C-terminal domain-containing protein, partial [Muribaculaceae bacterium]|nr:M24 family metallopeptidase C-terminal domain-containing protein [Muribaculaceae bacterium]